MQGDQRQRDPGILEKEVVFIDIVIDYHTYSILAGLPGFARDISSKIISISAFYF